MISKQLYSSLSFCLICLGLEGCHLTSEYGSEKFDALQRAIQIGHWHYSLRVENQNSTSKTKVSDAADQHFLKASLAIGNTKTQKSLLYSASRDATDYEAKYKYLAFRSDKDLYITYGNQKRVYATGYVFEPSNGLNPEERLVYKFILDDTLYRELQRSSIPVEYWYVDHIVGNGSICFATTH